MIVALDLRIKHILLRAISKVVWPINMEKQQEVLSQWIGCQRLIYNAKVAEVHQVVMHSQMRSAVLCLFFASI